MGNGSETINSVEPGGHDSARAVCANLHHAYRSLRLYPPGHPTPEQAFDALVETLNSHLGQFGALNLEVQEMRLLYEGEEAYSFSGSRDSLAFILFRDGIRKLIFLPGIETRELRALVDCLAQADSLADIEHDLATALWEQDLGHVEYEVVDPFISGEWDLLEGILGELGQTAAARQADAVAVLAVGEAETVGSPVKEMDWEAEGSIAEGQAMEVEPGLEGVLEESPTEVFGDFAEVLVEILGSNDEDIRSYERLLDSLAAVMGEFLSTGDLEKLELIITRLELFEREGCQPPGYVARVVGRALTPGRVAQLARYAVEEIGKGEERKEEESARRLLEKVREWVYPALLEVLAEAEDKAVRRLILGVLTSGQGVPPEYLEPLFRDPRWYVVRNAVHLAAESRNPALLTHLERLLFHSDPRVRREVVRGISALGGSKAGSLLATALKDSDSGVRTLAARGLARHGGKAQYPAVLEEAASKSLDVRPAEEVEEILACLAQLGGEGAVPVLDKLWRRRLFGTRSLAVRTAAIRALALIRGQNARRSLEAARKCGEAALEHAAAQALSPLDSRSEQDGPESG